MVGAIDAVCDVAQRIIEKLKQGFNTGGLGLGAGRIDDERPPTPAMKRYANAIASQKHIKPPFGYEKSGAICRAFLEQNGPQKSALEKNGEKRTKNAGSAKILLAEKIGMSDRIEARNSAKLIKDRQKTPRKRKAIASDKTTFPVKRSSKTKAQKASKAVATSGSAVPKLVEGNTPLRIPYGNKDVAQRMGARYSEGGWYAPPGVDLAAFKAQGWL